MEQKYAPGKNPIIKNLLPGLTERGKIKIGRKGKMHSKGFQLPEKLDHFIVTKLERSQDGNFLVDKAIHALPTVGQQAKTIPVVLLYDDISLNFQCRYACYFGKTLYCSGDGEYAHQLTKGKAERIQAECSCFRSAPTFNGDKNDGKGKCKINGTLSVMIQGADSVGGVWKFRTTGYNSTIGILSSLTLIKSITGGVLAGLPLTMTIHPKIATNPLNGQAQTIYVVGIEYSGNIKALQDKSLKIAQTNAEYRVRLGNVENEMKQLISADSSLVDEAGDIVEEFHPEEMQSPTGVNDIPTQSSPVEDAPKPKEPTREPEKKEASKPARNKSIPKKSKEKAVEKAVATTNAGEKPPVSETVETQIQDDIEQDMFDGASIGPPPAVEDDMNIDLF
ncbi:MAG: hypothetical protein KAI70_00585 [Candidatus Omnitrophica bacterium]|nr:hypothetical protein [Candidatus Omnitrophota bacterium]